MLANYGVLTDAIKKRADDVYAFADYDSPSPSQPRDEESAQAVLATFLDLVKVSLDDDYRRDVRIAAPRMPWRQSDGNWSTTWPARGC